MYIDTPSTITDILYEGKLSAKPPSDHAQKGEHELGRAAILLDDDELPTVRIGMPQWWNVADLYRLEGKSLPSIISLMLNDFEFFLLRMDCTLFPGRNAHAHITWARFNIDLRPLDSNAALPIAFHLYPEAIIDEKKLDVHVTFSPSLKFMEAEASPGSLVVDIHHHELLPAITAGGSLRHRFSWDMRATPRYPLIGIRNFNAILKSPRRAAGINATFDVHAEVQTPRGRGRSLLRPGTRTGTTDNLFVVIGGS